MILPQPTRAKVFSTADVRNGFWHINMDESSRKHTTFGTQYGRYQWNRMPFGITLAPEIFQRMLQQSLDGLKGVLIIANDILVVGKVNQTMMIEC